jgi:proliferating cell nuclear antigen
MFEATFLKAVTLKKIIEALKELVTDAKFDCTASGISLQAMDNSHVSLVALILRAGGFESYRCDRNLSLGLNLESLSKVLKAAGNDDSVTIRAEDDGDTVAFTFTSKSMSK